jgi:hypothetical protein
MAVKWTEAKAGDAALDVCCGSGDLAFLLAAAVGRSGTVSCDAILKPVSMHTLRRDLFSLVLGLLTSPML